MNLVQPDKPLVPLFCIVIFEEQMSLKTEKFNDLFPLFAHRHPMPDYYSLTLEVSRDRVTSARAVTCDSREPMASSAGGARCPPGYRDGQTYVHRSLNSPCNSLVSV